MCSSFLRQVKLDNFQNNRFSWYIGLARWDYKRLPLELGVLHVFSSVLQCQVCDRALSKLLDVVNEVKMGLIAILLCIC